MKILIKFTILTIGLIFLLSTIVLFKSQASKIVRASEKLVVTYPGLPMFSQVNWYPGKSEIQTLQIENTDILNKKAGLKSLAQNIDTDKLGEVISIEIAVDGKPVYGLGSAIGVKYLSDFYSEDAVWLGDIKKGGKVSVDIKLTMDNSADNSYQGKITNFDLLVGSDNLFSLLPTIKPLPTLKAFPSLKPLSPLVNSIKR